PLANAVGIDSVADLPLVEELGLKAFRHQRLSCDFVDGRERRSGNPGGSFHARRVPAARVDAPGGAGRKSYQKLCSRALTILSSVGLVFCIVKLISANSRTADERNELIHGNFNEKTSGFWSIVLRSPLNDRSKPAR